ncbi:MAG: hypothetical protein ACOH1V_07800 [Stenotrophomonas sp.]
MESKELLFSMLSSLGYRLPLLVAYAVALVMVFNTPAARARSVALWALAGLIGVRLVGSVVGIVPLVLIANGHYDGVSALGGVMNGAYVVLTLFETAGFVVLAWALVQALRGPAVPAAR